MGSVDNKGEAESAMGQIMDRMTGTGPDLTVIPTPLGKLNKLLQGGLRRTNLTVIAGRTSQGKTALACTILRGVAVKLGLPCVMYSYEMNPIEILDRMIAMEAGITVNKVKERGVLNVLQVDLKNQLKGAWGIVNGVAVAGELEIVTGDGKTIDDIAKDVEKRRKNKPNLAVVCIDYLQLVVPPQRLMKDSRATQVGYTTAQAKQLASGNDVCVLALSQLSRGVDFRAGEPALSDLRESGSIEQDANQVMFVFDTEKPSPENPPVAYHVVKTLNLQKNRNGPCNRIDVYYYPAQTQFMDYAAGKAGDSGQ